MKSVSRLSHKFADAYSFLKTYGQHLPLAAKALCKVSCRISMIRGSIRGSDKPVVVLYVGRCWNNDFLTDLLFEKHEVVLQEKANLFVARSRSKLLASDADIEIVDIGWPYSGQFNRHGAYLEFPDWINMVLPLEEDWDSIVRSFRSTTRNNDLRLIRRNQYRFEVTNDPEVIDDFYDRMYVPSVSRRHEAASIVAPKKHVVKRALQGKLLQVYRGPQLVIAGVVYPEDGILYFLWQGSPPCFQERSPEGAVSALYYFGIRYAFENDIGAVDFAGTRAFPGFGDFRFKRKWGAHVDDSFSPSSMLIRPLNNNKNTISFCEQLPLIARHADGLEAIIVRQGDSVDTDTLRRVEKYYNCDGLVRIVVINVSEQTPATTKITEVDGCVFQVIQCHPDRFSSRYVARSPAAD